MWRVADANGGVKKIENNDDRGGKDGRGEHEDSGKALGIQGGK